MRPGEVGPDEALLLLTHAAAFTCALGSYVGQTIMCWTRSMAARRRRETAAAQQTSEAERASTAPVAAVPSPQEEEAMQSAPLSTSLMIIEVGVEEATQPDIVKLPRWLIEAHARAEEEERQRAANALAHRFHARLSERFPELARRSVVFNEHAQTDSALYMRFMAQVDPAVPLEAQTDLILHGSPRMNLPSILANGLNRNPPFYVTTVRARSRTLPAARRYVFCITH
jgi:hypothetical protein